MADKNKQEELFLSGPGNKHHKHQIRSQEGGAFPLRSRCGLDCCVIRPGLTLALSRCGPRLLPHPSGRPQERPAERHRQRHRRRGGRDHPRGRRRLLPRRGARGRLRVPEEGSVHLVQHGLRLRLRPRRQDQEPDGRREGMRPSRQPSAVTHVRETRCLRSSHRAASAGPNPESGLVRWKHRCARTHHDARRAHTLAAQSLSQTWARPLQSACVALRDGSCRPQALRPKLWPLAVWLCAVVGSCAGSCAGYGDVGQAKWSGM